MLVCVRRVFDIGSFLDEYFSIWKFRIAKRLLVPLGLVIAAKIAGSLLIYFWMNIGSLGTFWSDPTRVFEWQQNKVFLLNSGSLSKWPFLFVGWDSAWYLSIITNGYSFSSQSYTFWPGLPIAGTLLNEILQNPLVSLVLCGLVSGVLWIPFFQLFAERYLGKEAAFLCALLFAFSPYIFVFTTIAYAEGLVLFFTLAAWVLLKKKNIEAASGLGVLAALSRITGILVVFPLLYNSLKKKGNAKIRSCILSGLPILGIVAWCFYGLLSFGDFFAIIHTTEWAGMYTVQGFVLQTLPQKGLQAFSDIFLQNWPATLYWLTPFATAAAVFVPPVLMLKIAKMDMELLWYSIFGFTGILVFGSIMSFPRFVSVLFPLWLPLTTKLTLKRKHVTLVSSILVLFFLISLSMWMSFLNGLFVA